MPTYSYACTDCDNRFDAVQAFSDAALTTCPEVRRPAAQALRQRRSGVQGQRLLPHRQPRVGQELRQELRPMAPPPARNRTVPRRRTARRREVVSEKSLGEVSAPEPRRARQLTATSSTPAAPARRIELTRLDVRTGVVGRGRGRRWPVGARSSAAVPPPRCAKLAPDHIRRMLNPTNVVSCQAAPECRRDSNAC